MNSTLPLVLSIGVTTKSICHYSKYEMVTFMEAHFYSICQMRIAGRSHDPPNTSYYMLVINFYKIIFFPTDGKIELS